MSWIERSRKALRMAASAAAAESFLGPGGKRGAAKRWVKILREAEPELDPRAALRDAAARLASADAGLDLVRVQGAFLSWDSGDESGLTPRADAALLKSYLLLEGSSHLNPWRKALTRAGQLLSNKSKTPFIVEGVPCGSAESYLLATRLDPSNLSVSREEVASLNASEARQRVKGPRREAKARTGLADPVWLFGCEAGGPIERRSPEFVDAMTEALLAKARTHKGVRHALLASGALPFVHYLTKRRAGYVAKIRSHLPPCLRRVRAILQAEAQGVEKPTSPELEDAGWLLGLHVEEASALPSEVATLRAGLLAFWLQPAKASGEGLWGGSELRARYRNHLDRAPWKRPTGE